MKKKYYPKSSTLIILFIFLFAQSKIYGQSIGSKIDSLLNNKYTDSSTGGVFLVSIDGKSIYKKAFGLSNLELKTPMKINNVFEIGSLTKQFTAISILILAEQGKLNLNDTIKKFIPDYPNGELITIHELLTHTSGIKDFTKVKGLNTIAKEDLTPNELIDFFKSEPMNFKPGEKFEYCNAGYILLGYIIELVSGKSYNDFVEQNIFKKLDMVNSYYASHDKIIPNRALGYSQKNDHYVNTRYISFSIPYSSGSLMSTVEDMLKWQKAIEKHILISEESTVKAFTNYRLNNGEPINYGYGWHIKSINGMPSYEHGGSIFGYKSMGVYLPDNDIYVIALSNCGCNSPTEVTRKIAEIVGESLN
ncbi:beta-lactamase family protein [Fulvivirga sp. 29W222]|uniref:Beta-lactamase family protein n=1 Tax=Fulvivirga marina TaxID=2494733 RepID=A0A937G038_9BACT|nr:serine hydrolase domain-containing protein [Fulvivirga marina]MBL6447666.1 beta-lactamase family protein [Fulvivirga marina]